MAEYKEGGWARERYVHMICIHDIYTCIHRYFTDMGTRICIREMCIICACIHDYMIYAMCMHMYMYICIHIHIHIYIYIYICMYIYVYRDLYVFICLDIYVYKIYAYLYESCSMYYICVHTCLWSIEHRLRSHSFGLEH